MQSSRRSAQVGLGAAALVFVGSLAVVLIGSSQGKITPPKPMFDLQAVSNAAPEVQTDHTQDVAPRAAVDNR